MMTRLAHRDAPLQDGGASLSAQSGNGAIITPMRRFPPPWTLDEINDAPTAFASPLLGLHCVLLI
jgi:hypothetical protein